MTATENRLGLAAWRTASQGMTGTQWGPIFDAAMDNLEAFLAGTVTSNPNTSTTAVAGAAPRWTGQPIYNKAAGDLYIGAATTTATSRWRRAGWATDADAKFTNPMTASGDIIIGGASGAGARLALATATNYVLTSKAGGPAWAAANVSAGFLRQTLFTTSTSWSKGADTTHIRVTVRGGGAGGGIGATSGYYGAGGGGQGGWSQEVIDVSAVSTASVTIGSGGSSGAAGGTTSFGSGPYLQAAGGSTGEGGSNSRGGRGGAGGSGSGGDINMRGDHGHHGFGTGTISGGVGGAGGGQGGGTGQNATGTAATAGDGAGGGGGGGAGANPPGGAGAAGWILVEEFAVS